MMAPLFSHPAAAESRSADPADRGFYFPTTGVHVAGQAVLLAIDDYLLPLRENVGGYLSTPKYRAQPVVTGSKENPLAPDQVASQFYGSVVHDGGKYRMWYYAIALKEPGDAYRPDVKALLQGPVCYAESDDGIAWTKPNLGQVSVRGSTSNNAIALPDALIEGVHVIKDESDPDPQRRFKMVYNPHNGKTWVIRTATSADGLHWKAAEKFGIDQFLETASFYRFNDLYVVNGQRLTYSDGGHPSGRQGRAVLSPDFNRWLAGDTEAFLLPEPADPAARGAHMPYDQVHLGVGAASFGNVAVGFYGLWHNVPGDEDSQKRWGWFGYGKISCDLGLVISNDGLHFREPVKGRAYISRMDTPATPVPGKNYPTILTQSGNGILNVGDETRIYFGRWLNADYGMGYNGEVALAVLPRDRWGSVGLYPPPEGAIHYEYQPHGSVWSAPVRLPAGGCRVVLNADHTRRMSVEVSDANFGLLEKFSGGQGGKTSSESGLDCAVAWPGGDLSALGGKTVRFKINLEKDDAGDARLFAIYLRAN
ncbi:MAG: hypothetical protein JWM88_2129 [Verrucomicrobia bacterium]|nr:hypothetical protein [Verrucomicrobiota bacterium]